MAVAESSDASTVAFAGVNSSQAQQQKNRNEHLRSFKVGWPRSLTNGNAEEDNNEGDNKEEEEKEQKKEEKGELTITALSRASLFPPEEGKPGQERETYQRILKISRWQGQDSPRIGAVATGFAPQGEIVLFNANTATPQKSNVLSRITLGDKTEAEDLDIIPSEEEGHFRLAYTDGSSLYFSKISSPTKPASVKPHSIYTAPALKKKKYKIRALRFMTPNHLLLIQNTAGRTGSELVLLVKHSHSSHAEVVRKRRLPGSVKVALGLDVVALSTSATGEKQYVLAASGGNHSIHVFMLDYSPAKGFGKFRPVTALRDVHPFSMTKIAFSVFTSPPHPITSDVPPQYLKLASVSVGNTAVVHTFPLTPYPAKSQRPRYMLVTPNLSDFWQTTLSTVFALALVVLSTILLHAFTEIRGGVPPSLGAADWLSPRIRAKIARPYMFENGRPGYPYPYPSHSGAVTSAPEESEIPTVHAGSSGLLRELLYHNIVRGENDMAPEMSLTIMVQDHGDGEISAKTTGVGGVAAMDEIPASAGKWDDLSAEQRKAWIAKLVRAGHLTDEDDEGSLQGVYFGELAD